MIRNSESFLNCVEYDEVQDVEGSSEDDDISELLRDLACGLDKGGDFEDDVESVQASYLDALRNLTNEGWANSREFASVVGTLVRKKISIACDDWRDVDIKQKLDVWTDIQEKLQETAVKNLELKEKTIQEGDLFAHVYGLKEPRGHVRVLGNGPTPKDVGTPGSPMSQEGHDEGREEFDTTQDEYQTIYRTKVVAPRVSSKSNVANKRNHDNSYSAEESFVGRDVILYVVMRNDTPVAKATIVSTYPKTIVGGQALGVQFYEVVVNVVLKSDTLLPRPYDDMETLLEAQYLSIAWPNNWI
ncbi:hypothetical protein GUJ93_ZPchr0002g24441 [Zizania palustris]|uniref:Transposase Tnp1/En/Spm-like domain-containing protein n=1 Tax=Zizania palustris TaxID=103762 RepID=A0A8J5RYJ3_ZIZPA|nr:hypothetical protein GUJ93_ZPchr0002g24441 [Zizania palustris]